MISKYPLSHVPHFWFLQLVFWLGLCVITYFTLTLWYGQTGILHLVHTFAQGVMGLALSLPLHVFFSSIWEMSNRTRLALSLLAVGIVAAFWTALRMITFIQITKEESLWHDFGGWYFGAIFVFLCWSSLYHGISYYYLLEAEHAQKEAAEQATIAEQVKRLSAEGKAKDAKLKMLRYQLNPHFLFNTLNAINSLVQTEQAARAQKMVVQLSKFLRYSLDNNPEMKIPLHREIDALNLYLEIEKTRFGDRLKMDFRIDENTKSALVPSLLMQPLIENSMKYAVAKNENGGTISLCSRLQNNKLVLELSDTGASEKLQSSKIKNSPGRGIGLHNTSERLQAFYGDEYKFDLSLHSSGGLKTTIEIPFELSPGTTSSFKPSSRPA